MALGLSSTMTTRMYPSTASNERLIMSAYAAVLHLVHGVEEWRPWAYVGEVYAPRKREGYVPLTVGKAEG